MLGTFVLEMKLVICLKYSQDPIFSLNRNVLAMPIFAFVLMLSKPTIFILGTNCINGMSQSNAFLKLYYRISEDKKNKNLLSSPREWELATILNKP